MNVEDRKQIENERSELPFKEQMEQSINAENVENKVKRHQTNRKKIFFISRIIWIL